MAQSKDKWNLQTPVLHKQIIELQDKDLKIIIIRVLNNKKNTEIRKMIHKQNKNINKEIETMKKN